MHMKLIDFTLKNFAEEVESLSPAPGGGSCSAYSSAVGVCLARMMANLSFNKKKYEAHDEKIKAQFTDSFEALETVKNELLDLVDKDTESFNEVMKAFKLPKETEEEKELRKEAIQKATWLSIETPYRVAELTLDAMKKMKVIYEYGNENALSDVGVGYGMCALGAEGAILNVKINLGSISDVEKAKQMEDKCNAMLEEVTTLRNEILSAVHSKLKL